MTTKRTARGFELVEHPVYPPGRGGTRLLQQSSAVGDHADAMGRPGTSFLWVGDHHHLDRGEVAELVRHLQAWLDTGSLEVRGEARDAAD